MAFPFSPMRIFKKLSHDAEPASAVRSIDAATGSKRGRGMGFSGPINPEIAAGATVTRGRTRYLALNHTFLSNGVGNTCAALVGSGARPSVKADDPDIRSLASGLFETWADVADYAGRTDFWGLQREVARHLVVDGEALVILHNTLSLIHI